MTAVVLGLKNGVNKMFRGENKIHIFTAQTSEFGTYLISFLFINTLLQKEVIH